MGFASTKREVSAAGGIGSVGFSWAGCCEAIGVDVRWTVKISAFVRHQFGALLVAFETFRSTG